MGRCLMSDSDLVFASCCNFNSFCISKREQERYINDVVLISESKDKKGFSLCDSPFPKVKLVNNAVQVKTMKNEQIPCPLQGNGFLFLPRAYGASFKLIASSQQWIKLPKSTCLYEPKPYYENKFKKNACIRQFLMEINANGANGCYPLCSRWRELGLLGISSHVNICIRHRNQSLDQHCKNFDYFFRRSD